MTKLTMVYPSLTKELHTSVLLYSPLAIPYLGRHTPDHFEITTCDEYVGDDMDPAKVDADLVAFSPVTPSIPRAYWLGDRLRERGIRTVVGGAHATALPDEALQHFDHVVMGEGEGPWREFLADFDTGTAKETYFGRMDVSLEHLGTPRRDLIHPNYNFPAVMTSRGCPYSCSFCYLTVYPHRKHRMIPHDTVLEDLDSIKGSPYMVLTDENFVGYSQDDIEDRKILLEKIIRKDYGFYWGCQSTVGLHKEPELMDLMHRAGCRAVFMGFEAMTKKSLKEVNKRQNLDLDYKDVVASLHKHKLGVVAACILGMDSQEKGYHKDLIKELKRAKADFPRIFLMTAWPGTQLYADLKKEGRHNTDWENVRKDMPSIEYKNFSHEELEAAKHEINQAFGSFSHISSVILRWFFKDRSIMVPFAKIALKNMFVERKKRAGATVASTVAAGVETKVAEPLAKVA